MPLCSFFAWVFVCVTFFRFFPTMPPPRAIWPTFLHYFFAPKIKVSKSLWAAKFGQCAKERVLFFWKPFTEVKLALYGVLDIMTTINCTFPFLFPSTDNNFREWMRSKRSDPGWVTSPLWESSTLWNAVNRVYGKQSPSVYTVTPITSECCGHWLDLYGGNVQMFICQTASNDMTSKLMENLAQKPNFTTKAFAERPTQNDVILRSANHSTAAPEPTNEKQPMLRVWCAGSQLPRNSPTIRRRESTQVLEVVARSQRGAGN